MSIDTQGDQRNCNRKKKELQFAKHSMCHGSEAEQNIKAENTVCAMVLKQQNIKVGMHLTGHEMPIHFI